MAKSSETALEGKIKVIREDLDRARTNVAALQTLKAQTNAPRLSQQLASDDMTSWFSSKMEASYLTVEFKNKVKELIQENIGAASISVSNITKSTKDAMGRWAVSEVSDQIATIMASNADKVVAALKTELQSQLSHQSGTNADKKVMDTVLKVIQKQITENKAEIEKFSAGNFKSDVQTAMSIAAIKAVFSDIGTAATKVMEILKLWAHLQPDKEEAITSAAQNLLNFQRGKGTLQLKSFTWLTESTLEIIQPLYTTQ